MSEEATRLAAGYYNVEPRTDANPGGLAGFGHLPNLPQMAQDFGVAALETGQAQASAINAPGTKATSSTTMTVETDDVTFTLNETGKAFGLSQNVVIGAAADPTNTMTGRIKAFNAGTGVMTVAVAAITGPSTEYSSWNIALEGAPATDGPIFPEDRGTVTPLTLADRGTIIRFTAPIVQTFDPAAELGEGWFVPMECRAASRVTLEPDGAEQIGGKDRDYLYPGETGYTRSTGAGLEILGRASGGLIKVASGAISATPNHLTVLESFDDPELDGWELDFHLVPTASLILSLQFNTNTVAAPSWADASFLRMSHMGSATALASATAGAANISGNSSTAAWAGRLEISKPNGSNARLSGHYGVGAVEHGLITQIGVAAVVGLRLLCSTSTLASGTWSLRARRK